jgi:5-hydroxyisourate hydrolase-like protein (transthyretin family)
MWLIARTGDGTLQGFQNYDAIPEDRPPDPLRIVLRPAQRCTVHVRDERGEPVEGAQVEYGSANASIVWKQTDASGRVPLLVPSDAQPQFILALKPGLGFDYAERAGLRDQAIELTLAGARALRIEAVDAHGRPAPGVVFEPESIRKPGRATAPNLTGSRFVSVTTDENGRATVDWLPRRLDGEIQFRAGYYPDWYCPIPLIYREDSPADALTVRLLRYGTIAGRVFDRNGRPAAGVAVKISGVGAHRDESYRTTVHTDLEGRYQAVVPPRHGFMISVIDDVFSAASLTDVAIDDGESRSDLDLTLSGRTRLYGRLKNSSGERLPGEYIRVWEYGTPIPFAPLDGSDRVPRPQIFRYTTTNGQGEYELRLGPGQYRVTGPEGSAEHWVEIGDDLDYPLDLVYEKPTAE